MPPFRKRLHRSNIWSASSSLRQKLGTREKSKSLAPTFKKSAATLSRRMSYFAIGVLVWRRAKRRETSYEIVCGSNCKLPRSLPGCWTSLKTQQPDFAFRHAGKLQIRLPPSRQNFLPRSRGGCQATAIWKRSSQHTKNRKR